MGKPGAVSLKPWGTATIGVCTTFFLCGVRPIELLKRYTTGRYDTFTVPGGSIAIRTKTLLVEILEYIVVVYDGSWLLQGPRTGRYLARTNVGRVVPTKRLRRHVSG